MRNLKKAIIVTFIIIIIILIILFFVFKKNILDDFINNDENDIGDAGELETYEYQELYEIDEIKKYYCIDSTVNLYVNSIIQRENEAIYNQLDPICIKELNINKENIFENVKEFTNYSDEDIYSVIIDKMYVSDYHEFSTYFVYGKVINKTKDMLDKFNIMITIDEGTGTYSLMPEEYMNLKKYNELKIGEVYTTEYKQIAENNYNKCDFYDEIDDYTIIMDHMIKLIDELVYDYDNTYNLFSEEYKEKKFPTKEAYDEYMDKNMNTLLRASIKKYKITEYDDYTEYRCIDQYGNYYIFKDKGVMNFDLELDRYTFQTDEDKEKYIVLSNENKAISNLRLINEALNRKDYKYLYEMLTDNVKNEKFKSLNDFEEYIKNNFYNINKFEYGEYDVQDNKVVYEVIITDATGEDENEVNKNFIINLENETNYTYSFNI